MQVPRYHRRAPRFDSRVDLPGMQVVEPTTICGYPSDLPPIVRVLLGIATDEEVRICQILNHHISSDDWQEVSRQVEACLKTDRKVSVKKRRPGNQRFLEVVQRYYC